MLWNTKQCNRICWSNKFAKAFHDCEINFKEHWMSGVSCNNSNGRRVLDVSSLSKQNTQRYSTAMSSCVFHWSDDIIRFKEIGLESAAFHWLLLIQSGVSHSMCSTTECKMISTTHTQTKKEVDQRLIFKCAGLFQN